MITDLKQQNSRDNASQFKSGLVLIGYRVIVDRYTKNVNISRKFV